MPVLHVMNHCYRYRCPELVNPAEFLADLMSIDNSSAESVYSSQKRIHGLVESFSQQTSSILYATCLVRRETSRNSMNLRKKTIVKKKGGWWRQFWLLLKRAWTQASRDGPTNKVRARMSIIFGSVFWGMGRSQSSIQDRMGLLQVAAINMAMAFLTKTGGVFPKERAIVDRECAKGSYALGPYLLSKLLAEIPVGAAFPLLFGTILYPMARLRPTLSSEIAIFQPKPNREGSFSLQTSASNFKYQQCWDPQWGDPHHSQLHVRFSHSKT